MTTATRQHQNLAALENAAKYICTSKCGLCPMVVEGFKCPAECDLKTLPWQCWYKYFRDLGRHVDS